MDLSTLQYEYLSGKISSLVMELLYKTAFNRYSKCDLETFLDGRKIKPTDNHDDNAWLAALSLVPGSSRNVNVRTASLSVGANIEFIPITTYAEVLEIMGADARNELTRDPDHFYSPIDSLYGFLIGEHDQNNFPTFSTNQALLFAQCIYNKDFPQIASKMQEIKNNPVFNSIVEIRGEQVEALVSGRVLKLRAKRKELDRHVDKNCQRYLVMVWLIGENGCRRPYGSVILYRNGTVYQFQAITKFLSAAVCQSLWPEPRLPGLNDLLIPEIENFCRQNGGTVLRVAPVWRQGEVLRSRFGFKAVEPFDITCTRLRRPLPGMSEFLEKSLV